MVENNKEYAERDFEDAVNQTRRRQIHARKAKSARDLVNEIIARRGIAAQTANRELQEAWDSAVGMDMAHQTRVALIRRGTLEIIVSNSTLMQMLSFEQDQLLKKLNQHSRKAEIKSLRFRLGSMY